MNTRERNLIVLVVGALLMAGGLWLAARSRPQRQVQERDAQQIAPRDAQALLSVDVPKLRASPFSKSIFGEDDTQARSVSRLCGFDPLSQVQRLVVWVGKDKTIGFVATGNLHERELVACASKVIAERKGQVRQEQRQGFTVIRDDRLGDRGAQIAVREGGPILLGPPDAIGAMLERLRQSEPEPGEQERLRAQVSSEADVVATAVIGDETRAQIRKAAGESTSALEGVIAVAVSLELSPQVELHARVFCEKASSCDGLAQVLKERQEQGRQSLSMRLSGIAEVLEGVRIVAHGGHVQVDATAQPREIARIADRIGQWIGDKEGASTPEKRQPRPDEVLRP